MKPICVKDRRFYRIVRSGRYFIEGMPKDSGVKPGNVQPEQWSPYKVWLGDLWRCPDCGHELISGVGASQVAEHYQPGFDGWAKRAEGLQINDC